MTKYAIAMVVSLAFCAACDKAPDEKPTAEETATPEESLGEAPAESADDDKPDDAKEPATLAEDLKPGEEGFYGARFTIIEPPVELAEALEKAPEHAGPYKVEATVRKVCKKKGCWFTMSDDSTDEEIRVRMKDYGFFVPRNAENARVVAEGTLKLREVPHAEAQHLADDEAAAGEEPEEVEGPQKEWQFTATAIQMNAAEG